MKVLAIVVLIIIAILSVYLGLAGGMDCSFSGACSRVNQAVVLIAIEIFAVPVLAVATILFLIFRNKNYGIGINLTIVLIITVMAIYAARLLFVNLTL